MIRFHYALATLLVTCTALAAPAPKPRPFVTGWKKPVDPDNDCKIIREKETLIMEMPGSDHDYNPLREQFNAPRLFRDREIEGDFIMQVRVRIDCRLSVLPTVANGPSRVSAGFLVIPFDEAPVACIRKEFGLLRIGSNTDAYTDTKGWNRKRPGEGMSIELRWKGDPYLRLERRDGNLNYYMSSDGENWKDLCQTGGVSEKVKVGLAAYSASSEPSKIQFDQFKLTVAKKKKR